MVKPKGPFRQPLPLSLVVFFIYMGISATCIWTMGGLKTKWLQVRIFPSEIRLCRVRLSSGHQVIKWDHYRSQGYTPLFHLFRVFIELEGLLGATWSQPNASVAGTQQVTGLLRGRNKAWCETSWGRFRIQQRAELELGRETGSLGHQEEEESQTLSTNAV